MEVHVTPETAKKLASCTCCPCREPRNPALPKYDHSLHNASDARHAPRSVRQRGAIGAGGMGEVYRARDTNLEAMWRSKSCRSRSHDPNASRDSARGEDARRVQPSEHRAHPWARTVRRDPPLVMELVDGDKLSQRISAGPIPPETLPIARRSRTPSRPRTTRHRPSRSEARQHQVRQTARSRCSISGWRRRSAIRQRPAPTRESPTMTRRRARLWA